MTARRSGRSQDAIVPGTYSLLGITGGIMGVSDANLLKRISVDPGACGGRPCVRGHRLWVSLILGLLPEGMSVAEILDDYPGLGEADVRACAAYGATLADMRFFDLADPPA